MFLRTLVVVCMLGISVALGVVGWQLLAPETQVAAVSDAVAAPAPPPARVRILVAARTLAAGTLMKDDDFVEREVIGANMPEGAIQTGEEVRGEMRGALLRRFLDAGEAPRRADLLRPRDRGFLAAVLRPGTRAISIGVDVVTGAAGLIWPGDLVDLILTQELNANDAPVGRRVIGETILVEVRVIAVDQQFTQGAGAEGAPSRIARTVTLEVTSDQAEYVAVASRLGRIALTLRAMEPSVVTDVGGGQPVFSGDVSPALARSGISEGTRMQVIQGDERKEVTFR
jgi:pilus assembly protein CpaB